MKVADPHPWPAKAEEARAIQDRLRPLADLTSPGPRTVRTLAGLDTACAVTLRLAPRYRLPATTRRADHLSRETLTAR